MTDTRSRSGAHLSEEERQGLADGSLPPGHRLDVEAHVATCDECAADVARLQSLMTRIELLPDTRHDDLDALWPDIRTRIEQGKVVPLGATSAVPRTRSRTRLALGLASVAGVAAVTVLAFSLGRGTRSPVGDVVINGTGNAPVVGVADSSRIYQEEVQSLLEELELRRSTLRPSTRASVDEDLRMIDDAIRELTDALAHDPNNPQLRQLLAASYRQKRDLLKQVDNAS